MKNNIKSMKVSGDVNFTEDNSTYHAPVTRSDRIRTEMAELRRAVQALPDDTDPELTASLEAAAEETERELNRPKPRMSAVERALGTVKSIAANLASAAGIVASVDGIITAINGPS